MKNRSVVLGLASIVLMGMSVGVAPAQATTPADYPITGIDVSAYQATVDWAAVAAAGAKFAYIRASEQAGTADAFFATNYAQAKANGLYAGAYHRARPDVSDGRSQADYLVDHSGFVEDGRTLPPMLDIEWPRSNWTGLNACYNMSTAQMSGWIGDFVTEVTARTGRLPMIYTNPNWWNPCTDNDTSFGSYPLFNSGYLPNPPAPPAGWAAWTLWQYSNAGSLPGDQDVFNGDYLALARLAGGTPFGLRAHANGQYVTAESAGTAPLIANRAALGVWERYDQVDAGGGYVALRAHANGRYVTVTDGGGTLLASSLTIGSAQKFSVTANSDGSVSLKALANDRYVTAETAGAAPLTANRIAIGTWEQFDEVLPPARISLRAEANGRFVTAENAGSSALIANRGAVGPWEQFDQVDAGNGYLALRARSNGRYVTAEDAGASPLIANRTAVQAWESFRAVVNVDASVSLLALADGRYVCAEAAGTAPLIANRTAVGSWERFRPATL